MLDGYCPFRSCFSPPPQQRSGYNNSQQVPLLRRAARCSRRRRRRATGANRTFKAGRTTDAWLIIQRRLRISGRLFLSRPSPGRPESKSKRRRLFSSSPPAASLPEQMNRRGSAPPTIYVYSDRLALPRQQIQKAENSRTLEEPFRQAH